MARETKNFCIKNITFVVFFSGFFVVDLLFSFNNNEKNALIFCVINIIIAKEKKNNIHLCMLYVRMYVCKQARQDLVRL